MAEEISKRDQTLKASTINEEYIANLARDTWIASTNERSALSERHAAFEESWRNLTHTERRGPWDNASNFHVPVPLMYGRAVHARLWQLFSSPSGFVSVQARQEMFRDRETKIKGFMDWILDSQVNSQMGIKRELDKWLWDVVFKGSGYLKCYWKREEREYREVTTVTETSEELVFPADALTGQPVIPETRTNVRSYEKEVERTEVLETPQVRRILWEDICLPVGETDPQDSAYVITRVYMTDDDLKVRAADGTFFKEAVEESLAHKENMFRQGETEGQIKHDRNQIDGYDDDSYEADRHVIFEYYGKAYVEEGSDSKESELDKNINKTKREIVAWVHKGSNRVLGWTYLSRISPSGIRPIFKADFMTFPDRSSGVGVAELLYDTGRAIDAMYNLRVDNGTLASIPMFAYRASSSLKPTIMQVKPGMGIPLDDPNGDMRQFQFPFLTGFGYQEEAQLTGYAEKLLAISELNLGRAPNKVGALRNATGANLLAQESGIQLEINFDRLAFTMDRMLQFLFRLCRERMSSEMFFRVTGELGEPIFGKVNRDDLKGEYDFKIAIDVLGQSQLEKQQQATLLMQTLMTPALMQTGVVTPPNLYALSKNYIKAHKIGRVDEFITKPQGYSGEFVTPMERISRIVVGMFNDPPVENTVRLDENHEEALGFYEAFKQSDNIGLFTSPEQVAALNRVIGRHQQLLLAQQSGGNPNISGMQVPRDGFTGLGVNGGAPGSETLQSPQGEVNGPVV